MPQGTYTFGPFSIDSESRLLFRNGERLSLPPKAADVLIALLERQGQLVTKDDLLRQVWPDTFVEEGNLARHIFALRQILGDSHPDATYIETVPKRGYRFAGPLQANPPSAVTFTAEEHTSERIIIEETEAPDPPQRNIRPKRVAVAIGTLIATVVLAGFVLSRMSSPAPVRSLLVLPFANVSMAEDAEYYSDGLTEELIGALSHIRGLRVVPRTTAFQFKGKSGDVRAIGKQLEVDAVLDGSVRREREDLRIHLSLTRVRDGHTMWSQTYNRKTADTLATQDEIARSVLDAVFPGEKAVDITPAGTRNPEAQNLYLKANFLRQKYTTPSANEALELFSAATRLDPGYAQAWAGLALIYQQLGYGYRRYPKDALPLAIPPLDRALAINPNLALAHTVRGTIDLYYFRDWTAAKRGLETAIELNPNDGEAHHWMSHYWVSAGRLSDAAAESRRALKCDPLSFAIGGHQVWVELQQGDYAAAIRAAEPTLHLDSQAIPALYYLARAYEQSGRLQDAIQVKRRMRFDVPLLAALESAVAISGAPGYWRLIADELERRRNKGPIHPVELARAYSYLGDRAQALRWLEQAVEERDPHVVYIKVDPVFASLRSEPQFIQLVRTAGIP